VNAALAASRRRQIRQLPLHRVREGHALTLRQGRGGESDRVRFRFGRLHGKAGSLPLSWW
jgi:hypothetical protein